MYESNHNLVGGITVLHGIRYLGGMLLGAALPNATQPVQALHPDITTVSRRPLG
jgi:hypothetical protein